MNNMLPRPQFWVDAAKQMKRHSSMVGETLILMLLYFLSILAQSLLVAIPMSAWLLGTKSGSLIEALEAGDSPQAAVLKLIDEMPEWMTLAVLFAAAALGAAALIYCLRFQKRDLASMGLRGRFPLGEYAVGFVLGLALILAVAGIGSAAGGFRLQNQAVTGGGLLLLGALLGCVVQGAALELLIRGYYTPSLGAHYPVVAALLMGALAPAIVQGGGSLFSMSSLNAILLGIFLGIWALKRGSIWAVCAIHAGWNFASTFLFDFAPAGSHSGIRLLDVDADAFRPLLTGGEYGPQASICATIVLLGAIAGALALRSREPAEEQILPEHERPGNIL